MKEEFIKDNVRRELLNRGFSACVADSASSEAARHYSRCTVFAKGSVYSDCLKLAKRKAKQMEKSGL